MEDEGLLEPAVVDALVLQEGLEEGADVEMEDGVGDPEVDLLVQSTWQDEPTTAIANTAATVQPIRGDDVKVVENTNEERRSATTASVGAKTKTTPLHDETSSTTLFNIHERRQLKQQAYLTKGCGKNELKTRVLDTFWDTVWPLLKTKLGWTKVRVSPLCARRCRLLEADG